MLAKVYFLIECKITNFEFHILRSKFVSQKINDNLALEPAVLIRNCGLNKILEMVEFEVKFSFKIL